MAFRFISVVGDCRTVGRSTSPVATATVYSTPVWAFRCQGCPTAIIVPSIFSAPEASDLALADSHQIL
jgi:hypothetical protein